MIIPVFTPLALAGLIFYIAHNTENEYIETVCEILIIILLCYGLFMLGFSFGTRLPPNV